MMVFCLLDLLGNLIQCSFFAVFLYIVANLQNILVQHSEVEGLRMT